MILVIDAYNVLKQVSPTTHITERIRTRFIQEVARYCRAKEHQAVLVFDAGPSKWPYKESIAGVQVVYSGTQMSADDYIKQALQGWRGRETLLISSDRALCSWALFCKVESLGALEFYALLQQEINKQQGKKVEYHEKAVKLTDQDNPELDALMESSAQHVPHKEQEGGVDANARKSSATTLSKKERRMATKLKKL
jgi:predicted RNA-binding protein with PIN domain